MYQLQWRSIYAIVGENVALSGLLENLLNKVDRICVTGVSKIPTNSSTISNFLARSISGEYFEIDFQVLLRLLYKGPGWHSG